MRLNRKRHRPEEAVAKLRQADEALAKGTQIAEVAHSLGVSGVTLYRWRAEYGAVDRDAVRRMKELERGNSEPGAAAPGDCARDGRAACVGAAGVPRDRAAPLHAAPHGAAGSVPGQAGRPDAGTSP